MVDLKQAAEEAQKFVQMLGGVKAIADALTEIGSYENAIGEVRTRHGVITSQVAELSAQLETKKADVAQAHEEAAAIREKANADAKAVADDARTKAETIVTEARVQAQASAANAEKQCAALDAEAAEWQDKLKQMAAAHIELLAEHKRVTDLVAQIKGA